ncbi:MAG: hypothetical protein AB2L20_11830 [Mangrovibacterium sp.]
MIELNDKQKEMIQKYLAGEIEMFGASEEEMEVMTGVIDMAEAKFDELDPEDFDGDLVKWFWEVYQNQEVV